MEGVLQAAIDAGRIEPQRASAGQGPAAASSAVSSPGGRAGGVGGVVADLVSLGAPVDSDKVSSLRQAIAEGRYAVDPDAIAERMIAAARPALALYGPVRRAPAREALAERLAA